ncbi:MAG TPA: EboA domain-containing protein, partial [Cyclobacteriaceae bacterium]|nr:EboA domain-containing protein [Cyclobacteriaceae bacterium]
NPYPANYLDEKAWNQMVIKSIFLQRPLYKIVDADHRTNGDLAKILIDFAHERWAAGRNVMPELWRFVGQFLTDEDLKDVQKVIQSDEPLEQEAVLLACSQSSLTLAQKILEEHPTVKSKIEEGKINWEQIGQQFEEKSV